MKSHREGNDEQDDYDGELEEGEQDVGEHYDIYAEEGELPDVGEKAEPGDGYGKGTHLPLQARP